MTFAIIALSVGLIAIVTVICAKRNKQLLDSGKIIQRQMNFWENAEYFLCSLSYEEVREAVLAADFSECGLSVTPDLEAQAAILFRCRHGWNALLRWKGSRDGANVFMFHFPAWRTGRYGSPYGVNQMNMTETLVERIFLSMDPDTAVECRRLQTKTKTRFI